MYAITKYIIPFFFLISFTDNSECCNPSLVAIYKCFSIVENFQKLKNYGENDYSFVYFVKVVILILVIYCNRFLHSIVSAEFNAETFKEVSCISGRVL